MATLTHFEKSKIKFWQQKIQTKNYNWINSEISHFYKNPTIFQMDWIEHNAIIPKI